tara:strand:+ start:68 stop:808 length:741 start_codon:yes stop_codon:yes gene_type:complete
MRFYKNTYNINKIKDDRFLAYTHLGLGDHIVCNGLLNHFSESFSNIYLPVKSRDLDNINYLYKDNNKIKVFKIEHETEVEDINNFAKKNNLTILKVGFKKRKPPFNLSFYEQFDLPYSHSLNKFKITRDEDKEASLFEHLKNTYDVEGPYQVVHNQSSYGKVDLQSNKDLPKIFIEKETDLHKNIFLYLKVIENAEEIHCLDSSFLHLVERVNTNADLFFHNIKKDGQKGAEVHLVKNWRIINYFN